MAGKFPKGYLFRPTDQELIQYLTWKILGVNIPLYTINKDVENIYACHPRDFDCKYPIQVFPSSFFSH